MSPAASQCLSERLRDRVRMKTRQKFIRFLDLTGEDINCDLHMHTTRTDGKADVKTILRLASERGLGRVAFTEHVRRDSGWFEEFAREVRAESRAYPELRVLVGCEAKALNAGGLLDASEEILAECDIVLGSVHRFPDGKGGLLNFADLSRDELMETELQLALGLLENAPIDVLAHPGGMYMRKHEDFPEEMMRRILARGVETQVAIEINSSYLRDIPAFLKLCAEYNPFVSIASDMHRPEHVGHCRDRLRSYGVGS